MVLAVFLVSLSSEQFESRCSLALVYLTLGSLVCLELRELVFQLIKLLFKRLPSKLLIYETLMF